MFSIAPQSTRQAWIPKAWSTACHPQSLGNPSSSKKLILRHGLMWLCHTCKILALAEKRVLNTIDLSTSELHALEPRPSNKRDLSGPPVSTRAEGNSDIGRPVGFEHGHDGARTVAATLPRVRVFQLNRGPKAADPRQLIWAHLKKKKKKRPNIGLCRSTCPPTHQWPSLWAFTALRSETPKLSINRRPLIRGPDSILPRQVGLNCVIMDARHHAGTNRCH